MPPDTLSPDPLAQDPTRFLSLDRSLCLMPSRVEPPAGVQRLLDLT